MELTLTPPELVFLCQWKHIATFVPVDLSIVYIAELPVELASVVVNLVNSPYSTYSVSYLIVSHEPEILNIQHFGEALSLVSV